MGDGSQGKARSSYARHLQQRAQELRVQLKRSLASAEANRNQGHAMDNYLMQAARLRKQIATTERRLDACKAREAEKIAAESSH
jgi:hypothetical protein